MENTSPKIRWHFLLGTAALIIASYVIVYMAIFHFTEKPKLISEQQAIITEEEEYLDNLKEYINNPETELNFKQKMDIFEDDDPMYWYFLAEQLEKNGEIESSLLPYRAAASRGLNLARYKLAELYLLQKDYIYSYVWAKMVDENDEDIFLKRAKSIINVSEEELNEDDLNVAKKLAKICNDTKFKACHLEQIKSFDLIK